MDGWQVRDEVRQSQARLQGLLDEALSDGGLSRERVEEALQELSANLEELRVAEEELTVQGEQLAASADTIDAERRRYAELFEFAPDGYVETDDMGKVVEANQAATILFGVSTRMLTGRLLVSFVDEHERHHFRRMINDVDEDAVTGERTFPMHSREGRAFIVGVTVARTLTPDAESSHLRWLIRDITDRVKLEDQVDELSDEVELLTGLSDVLRLVEGPDPLATTLQGIVELAHRSLPGCEVGISLVGRPEVEPQVGTGHRAQELDERQRQAGAGPCIEALERSRVTRGRPSAWPVLGDADDVVEVMGLPLVIQGQVKGALNVYSMDDLLDDHGVHLLSLLADQAAVALGNAHLFSSSATLASSLTTALETRGVIERAKGVLMAEQGCGADVAFDLLRRASQRENVKLHLIAARIADGAERRASPRDAPG